MPVFSRLFSKFEHLPDAARVLAGWTARPIGLWLFRLICLYPVLSGLVSRLSNSRQGMMDADAVLCAARAMSLGHSPYGVLNCGGPEPAPYVYAPQIAGALSGLVHVVGVEPLRLAYIVLLFVPSVVFLLWFALIRPMPGIDSRYRWLAVAGLAPMAFWSGNIGLVMHAAVLVAWLIRPRVKWLFSLAVLICAVIKPTFLSYFLLFLLVDAPFQRRLMTFAGHVAAGLAVTAAILLTAGAYGVIWREQMQTVALGEQLGLGWLFWTAGLHLHGPGMVLSSLVYMTVLALGGVAIAQWGRLNADERNVLGFGLAALITPRLMDYDMILIVPFAALVMRVLCDNGQQLSQRLLSWLYVGMLLFGVFIDLIHWKIWPRPHTAMELFAFLTVVAGARLAWPYLKLAQIGNRAASLPQPSSE